MYSKRNQNKKFYAQHGDVLLFRIDSVPEKAVQVQPGRRGHILAKGETTGHAHIIKDTTTSRMYCNNDERYLDVEKATDIEHEEHKSIVLHPGVYEIDRVVEVDHLEEEIRRVQD